MLSTVGLRTLGWTCSSIFPSYRKTLCYYSSRYCPGVEGYVALTIDDGLCRHGPEFSLAKEVRELLKEYGATATFFLCADYVDCVAKEAEKLLNDGNEFGNHCSKDRGYGHLTEEEFEEELSTSTAKIQKVRGANVRWFRAPQANYTRALRTVVERHKLRHALGDCYCDDYAVNDPQWIASTLLGHVGGGSIVVLHMPEKGFREHTLEALRLLLAGLKERDIKCVTLSKLEELACDCSREEAEDPAAAS